MRVRVIWVPLVASILWSALLIPGAIFLPIGDPANLAYQLNGRTVNRYVSLIRINGTGILWLVAVPLLCVLVATCFMMLQARLNSPVFGWLALSLAVLILIGAFVGTITFLVGIWVAPSGILLLFSVNNLRRQLVPRLEMPITVSDPAVPIGACGHRNALSANFCTSCGERILT